MRPKARYSLNIDFKTVNIYNNVGMCFLILTGNRNDIEWHDIQYTPKRVVGQTPTIQPGINRYETVK